MTMDSTQQPLRPTSPQAVIRQERDVLCQELANLQIDAGPARARLKALQRRCGHPRAYTNWGHGQQVTFCPDCGWTD